MGGFIVDILASFVLITLGFIIAIATGAARAPAGPDLQWPHLAAGLFFGFAATILGGYAAARWAGRDFVRHGVAVGALGMLLVVIAWNTAPLWYNFVTLLGLIPAGAFGGLLYKQTTD